ncbi:hypothetical protein BDU57DRAFT_578538 [Ampelomyces quisqualis]|uniref:BTB domain-containing protein n=1 Tax=Ampelomyces quisqualis TaxID=50730 RepID=A0A6A5QG50_AMPQU|nr:hypothetical protein BDU57DRAFT_578538 [Ampelomyces quisqualis]
MSDTSVPCIAPYMHVPISVGPKAQKVTVKVGQGANMHVWQVPAVLLWNASGWFRDQLQDADRNMRRRGLAFPEEDPIAFSAFIDFMYSGTLDSSRNLHSETPLKVYLPVIVSVFTFASAYDVPMLRNTAIDMFFLRMAAGPDNLPYHIITQVYENTSRNSSLRDLVTTTFVNIGRPREFEHNREILPRAFLVDCLVGAAQDETIPFEHRDRSTRKEWLADKQEHICEEYHYHDDDKDMGSDGGWTNSTGSDDLWGGPTGRFKKGKEVSEKTKRELAFIGELAQNPRYARY